MTVDLVDKIRSSEAPKTTTDRRVFVTVGILDSAQRATVQRGQFREKEQECDRDDIVQARHADKTRHCRYRMRGCRFDPPCTFHSRSTSGVTAFEFAALISHLSDTPIHPKLFRAACHVKSIACADGFIADVSAEDLYALSRSRYATRLASLDFVCSWCAAVASCWMTLLGHPWGALCT